jgi:hypothetical protein
MGGDEYDFDVEEFYEATSEWLEDGEGYSPVFERAEEIGSDQLMKAIDNYESEVEARGLEIDEEVREHFQEIKETFQE